jgi:predicted SprT family Zn-dependent metalloprotease
MAMTEREAEALALGLMSEHNLNWPAWGFRMTRHKLLLGRCVHNRFNGGTIELSKNYLHLTYEEIRDTILHEIAHALCGPRVGHSAEWKRMCIKIGATPNATADLREGTTPEFKWTGVCPNNFEHTVKRHALTEKGRRMACGQCCRSLNDGRFDARYLFDWHLTADLKASGSKGIRLITQPEMQTLEPTRISELVALGF